MSFGIITVAYGSNPLTFKSDAEREAYVSNRVRELCTCTADDIRTYLENRKMTKKYFSERTGISKWRLKRILDGNYGGLSLKDLAALSCEYSGEKDKATRKVLVEKFKKQY